MTTPVDIIAASPYLRGIVQLLCKQAAATGSFNPQTNPAPDGVARAFATNDAVDGGSRMPEPGILNGGVDKTAAGISVPKPPALKKPAKPPGGLAKPPTVLDGRTDKPAGMNLVQELETMNNGALSNASTTAFSRRIQGSPA